MVVAFILICVAPTKEHEVYTNLRRLSEIVEIYPLFGEFDFIAKLEVDKYDKIAPFLIDNIRNIQGVITTITHTSVAF
jgi:DNA-binding Lrp family transcriptional regulator